MTGSFWQMAAGRSLRTLAAAALALAVAPAALAQATTDPFGETGRDVNKRGSTASEFLQIPVGARATAMGNAVSASISDATAIYWNAAGLTALGGASLSAEYADWFNGINFSYTAVALPLGGGVVGAAVTALSTPEMEVTTVEQQDGSGQTFTAASYAFSLSYARALTDRFSIGGTAKYVTERIWNSNANGVAFDVGTLFVTPLRGIRLGASISNFGTKMRMTGDNLRARVDVAPGNSGNGTGNTALLETDAFDLPLTMRIGLAGELYQAGGNRLTLAVDALSPNNSEQYVNVGAEAALFDDMVFVRGGFAELFLPGSARGYTLGGGLHYGFGPLDVAFDYAYESNEFLNAVNRFTVSVGF